MIDFCDILSPQLINSWGGRGQVSQSTKCILDDRVNTYALFLVSSLPSSFTYEVCSRCLFNCGQKHVASKRIIFKAVCTDCKSRRKNYQWTLFKFDPSKKDFVRQNDLEKLTLNNGVILNYFHTIYTVQYN